MDIGQLIAFEHIVREGSFSRAAWSLGIAQPTISARIQRLEKEIGGALFKRGRKIALTELGDTFLPYARQTLTILQTGLEATRQSRRRCSFREPSKNNMALLALSPCNAVVYALCGERSTQNRT